MRALIEKIERALFGATAAERVEMLAQIATQRAERIIEARVVAALERPAREDGQDSQDGQDGCDDTAMPTEVCSSDCGQSFDPMDMEECGECFRLFCLSCFPAHEAVCGQETQEKVR